MRVSIFGPSGKVGRQALQNLFLQNFAPDLELVLISRNLDRLRGLLTDIHSTLPLVGTQVHEPRTIVTSNPCEVKGSDLVVIAAALWPSSDEARELETIDPSGRLAQSYANFDVVTAVCRQIAEHAPRATVVVVTNQSDMMSAAARRILPPNRVLGLGGIVDSARFRLLAARAFERPLASTSRAHMIGYHNADMMPLASSLSFRLDGTDFDAIVDETRQFGATISRLQRDGRAPHVDTGASVLPGYAIYATIAAFTGASGPLEEAFNVVLDGGSARLYGTSANHALSIPIRIFKGSYEVVSGYVVSEKEKHQLGQAQLALEEATAQLLAEIERRQ